MTRIIKFAKGFFRKKQKAVIYMKSGNVIELSVYNLEVNKSYSQVTGLKWELADNSIVMNINVDQVEAVIVKT